MDFINVDNIKIENNIDINSQIEIKTRAHPNTAISPLNPLR